MRKRKLIFVTGDYTCDHSLYKGNRTTADSSAVRGVLATQTGGGALLLKDLIAATMRKDPDWTIEFGLDPDFTSLPPAYHSYCLWEPQYAGDHQQTWRAVEPPLGYGHPTPQFWEGPSSKLRSDAFSSSPVGIANVPDIVVIDDAGIGFRDPAQRHLWPFEGKGDGKQKPRWLILKLTGSIDRNPLLDNIVAQCKENLVVVVPVEELRRWNVKISRGPSWEATIEDLTAELRGNPLLTSLLKARHLIVTFGCDGAYWLDNAPHSVSSLLVFDAARVEGEWAERQGVGTAFGFLSCSVAAVIYELCRAEGHATPDIESALTAGLSACRVLRHVGHGPVKIPDPNVWGKEIDNPNPEFPFDQIAAQILEPTDRFVSAPVPQQLPNRGEWVMLDEWRVHSRSTARWRPHFDLAFAVAVLGPEALERFFVVQFGAYQTVDRKEIENLRTTQGRISNYLRTSRVRAPLNLGVFGQTGSGKLFVVSQIAKATLGLTSVDILTFNLSQFDSPADLKGAFHQVRDKVISGITPLVFWDECDAQDYKWLPYLLGPMTDGQFQEGQVTHPIGKCIFVFSAATCTTYDSFGPNNPECLSPDGLEHLSEVQRLELDRSWHNFVLSKGPDFKSHLVGYMNVLGVNPRQVCLEKNGRRSWDDDPNDLGYPIRRALFIRSQFNVKKGERLNLDSSILRALLEVPKYKSGGRSLHAICSQLRQDGSVKPGRSSLPGHEFLDMHVDAHQFMSLCEQDMDFIPKGKELAVRLHEEYQIHIKGRPEKRHLDVAFDKLSTDIQDANLGQALRIPSILRLAGLHLESGPIVPFKDLPRARSADEKPIRQLMAEKDCLELLAEAEHNGWMVERMLKGWRYGRKRDNEKKCHDCLIPYSQLSEYTKNYDRWTIIGIKAPDGEPHLEQFGYVDIVKTVGLRVVKDNLPSTASATVNKDRSQRKDIFISYRREGGEYLAGRIHDALKNRGFSVFMDVENLKNGKFTEALLGVIESATDVIVVLTPECLDRCKNKDDWFRREIRHAIKCKRNVVPIMARGFEMPNPKALPSDIAELPTFNALTPAHELFEASIDKLVLTFLMAKRTG